MLVEVYGDAAVTRKTVYKMVWMIS
jgi:hypothetical protein